MSMNPIPWLPARRRIATLVMAALVLGSVGVSTAPVAAGAAATADIPGVPMPGPIAAGRLGGAIYDVVYSITVEPGHVIVASLTGTPGTDFDIYLFGSAATTVLSTTGLLTKSAGSTSTESISWPSRFGGTYYIDLNGATAVEGDFRLTVQTPPDPTPPSLTITLAGGRRSTNEVDVPVSLVASDDLSGVAEMAFSQDGTAFGAWVPFSPVTTWAFPPGDGNKALWAKVRNGVGLESPIAKASVDVDTVSPSLTAINPAPGTDVVGLRPTFSATFDEPIDPTTWSNLGLIVQSASGALVSGAYSYDATLRKGMFVPTEALQAGALYIVTVGDVRDVAGNRIASPGSWSVTPLKPTSLSITADRKVILFGESTRINMELSGAPLPAAVEVLSAASDNAYVPLTSITTNDGTNLLAATPPSNTTYRFRYAGAFGAAAAQTDVRVLVRRSVLLVGRSTAVPSTARVGALVTLTAAVSPGTAGASVSFRLYRFDAKRHAWIYSGSFGRATDSTGHARLAWRPSAAGSWYWRATVASTPAFANNTSPIYRWTISR